MPKLSPSDINDLTHQAFRDPQYDRSTGYTVRDKRGPNTVAMGKLAQHWAQQPNCGLPIPEGQPALVPMQ